MSTDPSDLSIEELESLLAERRAPKRFTTRLESMEGVSSGTLQKLEAARQQLHPVLNLNQVGSRVLLGIEIFAVLGLLVAGAGILFRLDELNRDAAQVQAQARAQLPDPSAPQFAPTLPAGSQPPSALTPDRFKGIIQQIVPVAIPTPGPQQPVRLVIPALNVDVIVVEGDDWEALKKGAGHHNGSANPGQRGNLVMSGHDDVFGEIFRYIGDLKSGDTVDVYSKEARYTYTVTNKRIVAPTDVSVLQATTDPTLTLITCHPYLVDTQRMVVFAQLTR